MYDLLHDLIQQHKTTLVFTNTRAGTERVVHNLKGRFPKQYTGILDGDVEEEVIEAETEEELENEKKASTAGLSLRTVPGTRTREQPVPRGSHSRMPPQGGTGQEDEKTKKRVEMVVEKKGGNQFIGAHHGSLSKTHRLNIENRLKNGELKAVVCSTSLELGIDIGSIDLVVLLGSPKSVARALQRIGRSGHKLHEEAKGRIIVLDRDDMVECSVLLKSAIEKRIDKVHIPMNALDVLAQQLFGLAIEKIRPFEELYWIVRRSHCYHTLGRGDFEEVIKYLGGEYAELEQRSVYAKIWYDRETGNVGKRGKLARLIYLTNVGTIPDETNVKVKIGEQIIGTIDEGFLERLHPGDVFVLGGETYEFRFSRGLTAQVKTSAGRPPTVPNWVSEMLPLSYDLALDIQTFRKYVTEMFDAKRSKKEIVNFIDEYLYADQRTLNSIYEYFREQHNYSAIPHRKRIVVEHFRDGDKRHAIIHSLYGRRVNDVLSRALAFALGRIHKRDVAVTITDNGFALTSMVPLNIKKAFSLLKSEELWLVMRQALDKTEVLGRRFRHCASRSLMILRSYKGNKKSVGKQQMNSRLLMSAVRRLNDDFPVLKEARREVLEDKMNITDTIKVLHELETGKLKIEEVTTELPSPFAFNIILQGYSDIMKMEDRIEFLKRMHEMILQQIDAPKKEKKQVAEQVKREKLSFSYETIWKEQEERRMAERDDEVESLKREVWNLQSTPMYAKEELIKLLEGSDDIRTDVKLGIEEYKEEILKEWSPKLVESVFGKLEIPYDAEAVKGQAFKVALLNDFKKAARKTQLDAELIYDFEQYLDNGTMTKELNSFITGLLKGTIPKIWSDQLVGFLRHV
jgi:Lhr-like helicase